MSQTKKGSITESTVNVFVGFGISMIVNILILGAFGLHVTLHQQVQLTTLFTVISIGRSYLLRRIFNCITARREQRDLQSRIQGREYSSPQECSEMSQRIKSIGV